MPRYEYRVIPAPQRAEKARGLKTTADRFAHTLTEILNRLGAEGWEYQRADTLPCEERSGLTGRVTQYQTLLTFRRETAESALPAMTRAAAQAQPVVAQPVVAPAPAPAPTLTPALPPAPSPGAPKLGPAD